jgi:hypothetical protein
VLGSASDMPGRDSSRTFLSWNEARHKFNLVPVDYPKYIRMIQLVPAPWKHWLIYDELSTKPNEFIGAFPWPEAHFPNMIFLTTSDYRPSLVQQDQFYLPIDIPSFLIGGKSMLLTPCVPPLGREGEDWIGFTLRKVRVVTLPKWHGQAGYSHHLFAGIIRSMPFDLGRWQWRGHGKLHSYTIKLGRKLLNPRTRLQRPMSEKWSGDVPPTYTPNWRDVWHKSRPQKEAGFLWSVFHKAVAVNYWRAQVIPRNPQIPRPDSRCICCLGGVTETILHRFHHCVKTQAAWTFGLTTLYLSQQIPMVLGQWDSLTWHQCVLGSKLPHKLKRGTTLWSLLRGSIIWTTWIDRNAWSFQHDNWSVVKLHSMLWEAFLMLGRSAKTFRLCQAHLQLTG